MELKEKYKLTITSVPINVKFEQIEALFEQLLFNLKNDNAEDNFGLVDIIAKSLSKSLAIKKGIKLSNKEQEEILNNLFLCKEPNYSPFGKKTFITLESEFFDQKFDR